MSVREETEEKGRRGGKERGKGGRTVVVMSEVKKGKKRIIKEMG